MRENLDRFVALLADHAPARLASFWDEVVPGEETDGERINDRLRIAIKSSGRSASDLAEASGVDAVAIARFMQGEQPLDLSAVDRLVEELGLTLSGSTPDQSAR